MPPIRRAAVLLLTCCAAAPAQVCYPNCDGSTIPPVLNVNDFACFLNRYAAADPAANCDESTVPPVLNVADFMCFVNQYAAGCPTEPVAGSDRPRAFLQAAATQRVALVRLGDSNQLLGGHGWDHGFQKASADLYGLYATPLISHNENYGLGGGVGYRCQFLAQGSLVGSAAATIPLFDDLIRFGGPISVHLLSSVSGFVNSGTMTGVYLEADWPGDVAGPLRYSIWTGRFPSLGGSFRPGWWRADTNQAEMYGSGPWPTGPAAAAGITRLDCDLPAAPRACALRAGPAIPGHEHIIGPWLATYQCVSNRDRLAGVSSHTFVAAPGRSLYDYAASLNTTPDATIAHFFSCVGELMSQVGQDRRVIILVDGGLNDRNATAQSLGPRPELSSTGPGFADNARALVTRITSVLSAAGWTTDEYCFVFSVSHPVSDNPRDFYERRLTDFRAALEQMALADGDITALNPARLTTASEMLALGYYFNGGADRDHLTQPAYEDLAARELRALSR